MSSSTESSYSTESSKGPSKIGKEYVKFIKKLVKKWDGTACSYTDNWKLQSPETYPHGQKPAMKLMRLCIAELVDTDEQRPIEMINMLFAIIESPIEIFDKKIFKGLLDKIISGGFSEHMIDVFSIIAKNRKENDIRRFIRPRHTKWLYEYTTNFMENMKLAEDRAKVIRSLVEFWMSPHIFKIYPEYDITSFFHLIIPEKKSTCTSSIMAEYMAYEDSPIDIGDLSPEETLRILEKVGVHTKLSLIPQLARLSTSKLLRLVSDDSSFVHFIIDSQEEVGHCESVNKIIRRLCRSSDDAADIFINLGVMTMMIVVMLYGDVDNINCSDMFYTLSYLYKHASRRFRRIILRHRAYSELKEMKLDDKDGFLTRASKYGGSRFKHRNL